MLADVLTNTLEFLITGGWVMIPLMIVCFIMFYLIAVKFIEMQSFSHGDRPVADCLDNYNKPVFTAAFWQKTILDAFMVRRTFNDDVDRNIVESLRLRQEGFVRRHIGAIAVLAGVAPLLGLLGTVSGMINTFNVIAKFGTGNAKALSSGISEALITTETGLVIAVPGLLLASFLKRRSENLLSRMSRFCIGLLRYHKKLTDENVKGKIL